MGYTIPYGNQHQGGNQGYTGYHPVQAGRGYGNQGGYGQDTGMGYPNRGGMNGPSRGRFQRGGYGGQGGVRRNPNWIPDEWYSVLKDSCFLCGDPGHRVQACSKYNSAELRATPCNHCRERQVILMHAHSSCREGNQNNPPPGGLNQGQATGQGYHPGGRPPQTAPARVNQPPQFESKNSNRGGSR